MGELSFICINKEYDFLIKNENELYRKVIHDII